jgi:hypothetical protein
MEKKTEFKNIYQKLLIIQQKINGLGKDKATYNYKYVTGDKVLGEIKLNLLFIFCNSISL